MARTRILAGLLALAGTIAPANANNPVEELQLAEPQPTYHLPVDYQGPGVVWVLDNGCIIVGLCIQQTLRDGSEVMPVETSYLVGLAPETALVGAQGTWWLESLDEALAGSGGLCDVIPLSAAATPDPAAECVQNLLEIRGQLQITQETDGLFTVAVRDELLGESFEFNAIEDEGGTTPGGDPPPTPPQSSCTATCSRGNCSITCIGGGWMAQCYCGTLGEPVCQCVRRTPANAVPR